MNFAGALEKNAGKECIVRSLSWKMKRLYFLRRECYEELEQGRTLPCPQKS